VRRSPIKTGRRSIDRGSTFKSKPRGIERRGELQPISKRKLEEIERTGRRPCSTLRQAPPKRRDGDVVTRADRDDWHELVCRSRWCVKDCGRRAGPHGHHAIEKQFLLSHPLLVPHSWDFDLGVGVCEICHSRHTSRFDPITRGELIAAGYWQTLIDWARMLDARYFPGAHPVEARLERDYPASTPLPTEATNERAD
jgi:hypothetical protein